jgi:hypothetical protein
MKHSVSLRVSTATNVMTPLAVPSIPYRIGRQGYCECRLLGKEVSPVHCAIAKDPERGLDPDVYSGICVVHRGSGTTTTIDECTLEKADWISLEWGFWYPMIVGEHLLEVLVQRQKCRIRNAKARRRRRRGSRSY